MSDDAVKNRMIAPNESQLDVQAVENFLSSILNTVEDLDTADNEGE